jgi:ATP-binding cassette, subfamily G (WHITE), member 2, PDR
MHKDFRGEVIYMSETDVHFPMLTVGNVLTFTARARAPHNRLAGITLEQYAIHIRDVVMALFGLAHTVNTMVGNDFIRGISGGKRKRVSIAEFIRTVRIGADAGGLAALISVYQCSQSSYVSLAIQQSEQY